MFPSWRASSVKIVLCSRTIFVQFPTGCELNTTPKIPIMRPKLPSVERLVPYLQSIDRSRFYSNFGPLALSLEERLAAHYGLGAGTVATVANATLGLALALMAQNARPGTLCVLPAWTFVGTVHAVVTAGLIPYFVDVDPETWAVDIAAVGEEIARAPATVGAIMPVAPFGHPIDIAAWGRFQSETAIPVVIDAAAGFDSLRPGVIPAVVSLHATKVLGVGEGGFVISTDPSIAGAVRRRSNFGFDANRQVLVAATNAKLSEYHAAVGHAALDEWPEIRSDWMAAAVAYRRRLENSNNILLQTGIGGPWIGGTCVVRVRESDSVRAQHALAAAGIETRRWWDRGAHAYPATATFPRAALTTTTALARSTFAVPFSRDLAVADIDKITEVLLAATSP